MDFANTILDECSKVVEIRFIINECEHPGIDEKSVKQSEGLERINDLSSDRFIGEIDVTPDWCPISKGFEIS